MFDLSPEKILVLLVIAMVVLGPGRLLEAARALGRARAHLRQFTSALPPETVKMIRDPQGTLFDVLAEPRQAMADVAASARQSITPTTEQHQEEGHDDDPR